MLVAVFVVPLPEISSITMSPTLMPLALRTVPENFVAFVIAAVRVLP
jgi:hypothetical protein